MPRKDTGAEAMYQLRRTLMISRWDSLVVWVDPGESTGWAVWVHGGSAYLRPEKRFHAGQSPWLAACDQVSTLCTEWGSRIQLGWEDFLIAGAMPHDTSALKVIGTLEWITHRAGGLTVLRPQPSSARTLATSGDKVARLGWYRPGERDANAAAAHLLSHLIRVSELTPDQVSLILPEASDADR